jgi:EmrB/QacA subfamily drug resistance transporter
LSVSVREPCDEGVIRAGAADAPCGRAAGRWVLAATILGSGITFIDGTVVNVALPVLQRELGATVTDAQWIVESYALMLAALLLTGGSLGDRYGRKRVFAVGVALFALASAWCGLSPNVEQLIFARAVQGVGAALLVPGSLAIISASFSNAERGRAIGTWSGFTAIAAGVGPVLGGWLIEHVSWRWIFFINAPLAVVVLLIVWRRVPESRDPEANGRLDYPGALLATLGLGGVVFGLTESNTRGFGNALVVASIIVGVVALALFVIVERREAQPMMPLGLFSSRTFAGANLLTLMLYAALGGVLFFLPFNLIQVQKYSATEAGAALLPFVLTMFLLSRWAGGLVGRYGARLPLVVGPVVAGLGFALLALPGADAGSYWTSFFPAIMVMSCGMATSVAPLTTTVMGAVKARHTGIASGVNNAVSRTAGLLAIAVLGILMVSVFDSNFGRRLGALDLSTATRARLEGARGSLAAARIPDSASDAERRAIRGAINESFVAGFRLVSFAAAGLAALGALASWSLIEGRDRKREVVAAGASSV